MHKRLIRLVLVTVIAAAAHSAAACGFCLEDKIAAVYDHAVVAAAVARNHQVAFFGLDGKLPGGDAERRALERIAQGIRGVDPVSARVSTASASLAVAFDPQVAPYAVLDKELAKRLAPRGLTLSPLRVIDRQSATQTAARP